MAGRPKVTHTVSIQEMLNMREIERLTNAEIGRKLGISDFTVRSYIGPAPADIVREARSRGQKKGAEANKRRALNGDDREKPSKYRPPYDAKSWKETTTIHKLSGLYANYEVNSTINEIEITFIDGYALGKMNKADLLKLIDEFTRVARILEK